MGDFRSMPGRQRLPAKCESLALVRAAPAHARAPPSPALALPQKPKGPLFRAGLPADSTRSSQFLQLTPGAQVTGLQAAALFWQCAVQSEPASQTIVGHFEPPLSQAARQVEPALQVTWMPEQSAPFWQLKLQLLPLSQVKGAAVAQT